MKTVLMMDCKQKDIVIVNLYPKKGEEVEKIRPCIVLSDSLDNKELDTLIVVPLSTQLIDDVYPYRVRLKHRDKLKQESDVLINQLRTVSKKRVSEYISHISTEEYQQIKEALCQMI